MLDLLVLNTKYTFYVFTRIPLLFVGFIVVTLTTTRIYAFEEEQEQISGKVLIHDVALTTQVKTNHWRIYEDAPLLGPSFT